MKVLNHIFIFSLIGLLFSCTVKEDHANTSVSPQQKLQNQFKADLEHYFSSYNNEAWDEVHLLTYPPLNGNKSKDDKIADYIQTKMMGIKRTIEMGKIEKVSKLISDDTNTYCKIFYGAKVDVTLTSKALEHKNEIISNIELSLDDNNWTFDENNNTVTFNPFSSTIAISKKGSNFWQYIEVDKQKEPLYSQIIPQNVLDQLDE